MARITYSALVNSINGSIGGTTFQRNRYGSTAKGKPITVNPNTAKQNARKIVLQAVVSKWKNLTPAQRTTWNSWAAANPVPSRLNPNAYLNGFNLFVAWHMTESLFNPATTLASPSFTLGNVNTFTIACRNITTSMRFEIGFNLVSGSWVLLLFASGQVTDSGYVNFNPCRFMEAGAMSGSGIALLGSPQYQNTFGALTPVGGSMLTRVTAINQATGQIVVMPVVKSIVTV